MARGASLFRPGEREREREIIYERCYVACMSPVDAHSPIFIVSELSLYLYKLQFPYPNLFTVCVFSQRGVGRKGKERVKRVLIAIPRGIIREQSKQLSVLAQPSLGHKYHHLRIIRSTCEFEFARNSYSS